MPPDISALSGHTAPSPVFSKPIANTGDPAAPATGSVASSSHASPVSLLDPSTGLVVLEFYDAKGDETASLPTKKQLDLYRLNEPSPTIFEPAIRDVSVPMTIGLQSKA